MRVVYWGTYDKGKPRNRILLKGLRENGVEVQECNRGIWAGVEDKTQVKGKLKKCSILLRLLLSYPALIIRYLQEREHSYVIVGYLGHFDVLVLWFFAKIKGKPIVWDAFISLYDTIVCDRKLLSPGSIRAKFLFRFEQLACQAADLIVLDTEEHARFFQETYSLHPNKCVSVLVGAETEKFPVLDHLESVTDKDEGVLKVLFYGQFIPLHGIETIVQAAELLREESRIEWLMIGSGQEEDKIQLLLDKLELPHLTWIKWVNYEKLKLHIHNADVCLGIFGTSEKASRVIPNKVFQVASCGKMIVTRKSPAIHELFSEDETGIFFVTPGSATELAEQLVKIIDRKLHMYTEPFFPEIRTRISPKSVALSLISHMQKINSLRVQTKR